MKEEDVTEILREDMDEELLKRMPLWFRRLKEAHEKKRLHVLH